MSARNIAEYQREIEDIRRGGADLTRPHYVGHSVIFERREQAEQAGKRIEEYGFHVSVTSFESDGPWVVFAGDEQVLNARHIYWTRQAMERVAAEFGGEYDDWEVGIHMENWPDCGCPFPDEM